MSIEMYQENILDHYEFPRNFGRMKKYDVIAQDSNTLCGDSFSFMFKFENNKVKEVMFEGRGCAISTASASMLSEKIKGMNLEDIKKIDKEDIISMLGIELSFVRIKCALLPLKIKKTKKSKSEKKSKA